MSELSKVSSTFTEINQKNTITSTLQGGIGNESQYLQVIFSRNRKNSIELKWYTILSI